MSGVPGTAPQPNDCIVEAACDRMMLVVEITRDFDKTLKQTLGFGLADYKDALKSLLDARRIVRSIGLGYAYISPYRGRDYLVVKGYPREMHALKGNRYLANNARVTHISGAVGNGLVRNLIRAPGISVITTCALEVVAELAREPRPGEDPKWGGAFFGGLVAETLKAASAGVIASAFAWWAAIVGAPVVVPILVGMTIGIGAAMTLDYVDRQIGFGDRFREIGRELATYIEKDRETWPRNPDGTFAPRFGVDYPLERLGIRYA
jgi:hypothetical protein